MPARHREQLYRGAISIVIMIALCSLVWFGLDAVRDLINKETAMLLSLAVAVAALVAAFGRRKP